MCWLHLFLSLALALGSPFIPLFFLFSSTRPAHALYTPTFSSSTTHDLNNSNISEQNVSHLLARFSTLSIHARRSTPNILKRAGDGGMRLMPGTIAGAVIGVAVIVLIIVVVITARYHRKTKGSESVNKPQPDPEKVGIPDPPYSEKPSSDESVETLVDLDAQAIRPKVTFVLPPHPRRPPPVMITTEGATRLGRSNTIATTSPGTGASDIMDRGSNNIHTPTTRQIVVVTPGLKRSNTLPSSPAAGLKRANTLPSSPAANLPRRNRSATTPVSASALLVMRSPREFDDTDSGGVVSPRNIGIAISDNRGDETPTSGGQISFAPPVILKPAVARIVVQNAEGTRSYVVTPPDSPKFESNAKLGTNPGLISSFSSESGSSVGDLSSRAPSPNPLPSSVGIGDGEESTAGLSSAGLKRSYTLPRGGRTSAYVRAGGDGRFVPAGGQSEAGSTGSNTFGVGTPTIGNANTGGTFDASKVGVALLETRAYPSPRQPAYGQQF